MKLDVRIQMLVLLAGMVRTNLAIRGLKQQVLDRCTLIVALPSVTLPRKKWIPSICLTISLTIDNHSE